jgi:hypothetical protein
LDEIIRRVRDEDEHTIRHSARAAHAWLFLRHFKPLPPPDAVNSLVRFTRQPSAHSKARTRR